MNIGVLLDQFRNTPQVKNLLEKLVIAPTIESQKIYLSGLHGSSPECIISALYQRSNLENCNHLIVLSDAEDAAYFFLFSSLGHPKS